jgi:plastocyanin
MRRILRVGAGLALIGVIATLRTGGHAPPVRAQMAVEIDMLDNHFGPHDATVAAGGTVLWVNAEDPGLGEDGEHDVVDGSSGAQLSPSLLMPGDTFSFEFDSTGVFTYLCDIHQNMDGTITVQ